MGILYKNTLLDKSSDSLIEEVFRITRAEMIEQVSSAWKEFLRSPGMSKPVDYKYRAAFCLSGKGAYEFSGCVRSAHVLPTKIYGPEVDESGRDFVYLDSDPVCGNKERDPLYDHAHYLCYVMNVEFAPINSDLAERYEIAFGVHHDPETAVQELWHKTVAFVENLMQEEREQEHSLKQSFCSTYTSPHFQPYTKEEISKLNQYINATEDRVKLHWGKAKQEAFAEAVNRQRIAMRENRYGKTPTNYNAAMSDNAVVSNEDLLARITVLERVVENLERGSNK